MKDILIITLEPNADVSIVKKELESLGVRVSRHLPYLNVLIVESDPKLVEAIKKISGVRNVERNKRIQPR